MTSEVKKKGKAGRKKHVPPLKKRNLSLTDEEMKLLRMWGRGSVSAGLRWLIAEAAKVIVKPESDDLHNNV